MAFWLARAGRQGEWEGLAQEQGRVLLGWVDMPDLTPFATKAALHDAAAEVYSGDSAARLGKHVGQLWALRDGMRAGDLVAMPLKAQGTMLLGEVTGPYQWVAQNPAECRHSRPVAWKKAIARSAFDSDIRNSFGGLMTLSRVRATDAERRVRAMLAMGDGTAAPAPVVDPVEAEGALDLPQIARDGIAQRIITRFKGHAMAALVEAILRAQGYVTFLSPPGKDGGVDVLAGSGPLGFDAPRIAVQVKSTEGTIGIGAVNELLGVRQAVRADRALLVAWGGLTQDAARLARSHFFDLRVWKADDLVAAVQDNYERLPDEVRVEIPLERLWALVVAPDEAEG